MTPRYPGAFWKPAGTFQGKMRKVRGVSLHEAVTTASSVYGWVQSSDACHLFTAEDGTAEQYKEFDEIAYGVKDGNSTMLTWESWDGLAHGTEVDSQGRGSNQTKWSWQQCERFSDGIAWMHLNLGIPIRMMASSASSESGVAPHRWGVRPWKADNGESWTKHDGKTCPGDLRIAQIDGILARARVMADSPRYEPYKPGPITALKVYDENVPEVPPVFLPTKEDEMFIMYSVNRALAFIIPGIGAFDFTGVDYNDTLARIRAAGVKEFNFGNNDAMYDKIFAEAHK